MTIDSNSTPLFRDAADLDRKVRSHDADSSWSAARITRPQQESVKDAILIILGKRGPLTDDEIYYAYRAAGGRRTPQRVRTARAELVNPKHGRPLVRLSNVIGISATGADAQKWEVV